MTLLFFSAVLALIGTSSAQSSKSKCWTDYGEYKAENGLERKGKQCLQFEYDGKSYNDECKYSPGSGGYYWCALETDENGVYKSGTHAWGQCYMNKRNPTKCNRFRPMKRIKRVTFAPLPTMPTITHKAKTFKPWNGNSKSASNGKSPDTKSKCWTDYGTYKAGNELAKKGKQCKNFEFNGKTYNDECKYSQGGYYWCALETDENGVYKSGTHAWGQCYMSKRNKTKCNRFRPIGRIGRSA